MKSKPKITKSADGWVVERPAYGFAPSKPDGPYPTHAAALDSLTVGTGAATPIIERTETPEPPHSYWGNPPVVWPGVIR